MAPRGKLDVVSHPAGTVTVARTPEMLPQVLGFDLERIAEISTGIRNRMAPMSQRVSECQVNLGAR